MMARNLAVVTEPIALPCSVICQSGRFRAERWNEVLSAFSPVLH